MEASGSSGATGSSTGTVVDRVVRARYLALDGIARVRDGGSELQILSDGDGGRVYLLSAHRLLEYGGDPWKWRFFLGASEREIAASSNVVEVLHGSSLEGMLVAKLAAGTNVRTSVPFARDGLVSATEAIQSITYKMAHRSAITPELWLANIKGAVVVYPTECLVIALCLFLTGVAAWRWWGTAFRGSGRNPAEGGPEK